MSKLTESLLSAMRSLKENDACRQLLAEYANVRHNGFENLFQAELLWTFNTLSPRHYLADLERGFYPLSGNQRIDLVVFDERDESGWWEHYWCGRSNEMLRLCKGFVEIKLVRDQNAPYYVGLDIAKLRKMRQAPENRFFGVDEKEFLAIVLLGGIFSTAQIAEREIEFWKGCDSLQDKLNQQDHLVAEEVILHDEPVPSNSEKRCFIKALLVNLNLVVGLSTPAIRTVEHLSNPLQNPPHS